MSEVQEAVIETVENAVVEQPKARIISDSEWETIRNTPIQEEAKAEPKVEPQAEIKQEAKPEIKQEPEVKVETKAETKAEEVKFDPFKELGFEEEKDKSFISKIHEAYKEGKLEEFLEKSTKNIDKLSDEQVLRIKVEKNNPNLSTEDIDFLVEDELEKYGIVGEDGEPNEKAQKRMSLELRKVREELKSEQESYKASAYERKPSQEQIAQEQYAKAFVESVNNDPYFAELGRSKALQFGDFKVEVPSGLDVKNAAIDPSILFNKVFNSDGSLNSEKFAKWAAFSENPDKVISDAIAYGKSLGTKETHDELRGVAKVADTTLANDKTKAKLRIVS